MIPEKQKAYEIEGNVTGEKIVMGIDVTSMPHIMKLLTDLYTDRELAVIREYSTNGRDAHIQAGITRPIEVWLPTPLNPTLRIVDFGVGLTAEDIRLIYSQYGASTKRTTNDQTGMLGLGCKAALTYTNQFTVTSVKDGRKVVVLVSRDAAGAGHMKLVSNDATDDDNGTEVSVPAERHNTFEQKATRFFSYWEKGTVLVNGEEPKSVEGLELAPDLMVVSESRQHKIIMGNVAYPWSPSVDLGYNYSLVARVPIGSVEFPPARESLTDTDLTKATQKKVEEEFKKHAAKAVQKAVNAAKTPFESIMVMREWEGMFPNHTNKAAYTYKGKPIPTGFDNLDATVAPFDAQQITRHSNMKSLNIDYFTQSIFVVGYDLGKFTATHKKKLNKWAEDNGQDNAARRNAGDPLWRSYVLLKDLPKDRAEWLLPEQVIKWDDVAAIKLPRNTPLAHSGRIPGSYDCKIKGTFKSGVPADDIDQTNEILYLGRSYRDSWHLDEALTECYPDATVVYMASNRVDKFCRHFPQAEQAVAAIRAHYKKWWAKVHDSTKIALAMRNRGGGYYNRSYYSDKPPVSAIDPGKVKDPELAKCAKMADRDLTKVNERLTLYRNVLGHTVNEAVDKTKTPKDPLVGYPLFDAAKIKNGGQPADHMYLYLNAAYAARTKED